MIHLRQAIDGIDVYVNPTKVSAYIKVEDNCTAVILDAGMTVTVWESLDEIWEKITEWRARPE